MLEKATFQMNTKLTILDRSIPVVLNDPDNTPSRLDGISAWLERIHRLHGTSLLFDACKILRLGASICATACSIFHRFYHRKSLREYDVWSIAVASIMLSTKVEEEPRTLKAIIRTFCHIYRQRVMLHDMRPDEVLRLKWDSTVFQYLGAARSWSLEKKEKFLKEYSLPTSSGPVHEEWHKKALASEAVVLRELGFTLHWISDTHPHKFLLYFAQALGLAGSEFTQRAWNYCNDSCRLDLSVRCTPEILAACSIFLASLDFGLELPTSPRPWWEALVGKDNQSASEIAIQSQAILSLSSNSLRNECDEQEYSDVYLTAMAYVVSSLKSNDGGFTDPSGFLWDQLEDATGFIEAA